MWRSTKRPRLANVPVIAFALTLAIARPAWADPLGLSETTLLGSILTEEMKSAVEVAQLVVLARDAAGVASQTLGFIEDAVSVVENVAMIIDDPVAYLEASAKHFVNHFPELKQTIGRVKNLKRRIGQLGFDGRYDPYASIRMWQAFRDAKDGSASEILMAIGDKWGISDAHEQMMEYYADSFTQVTKLRDQVEGGISGATLTPQMAAVETARATALSAELAVNVASTLQVQHYWDEQKRLDVMEATVQSRVSLFDQLVLPDEAEDEDHWRLKPFSEGIRLDATKH